MHVKWVLFDFKHNNYHRRVSYVKKIEQMGFLRKHQYRTSLEPRKNYDHISRGGRRHSTLRGRMSVLEMTGPHDSNLKIFFNQEFSCCLFLEVVLKFTKLWKPDGPNHVSGRYYNKPNVLSLSACNSVVFLPICKLKGILPTFLIGKSEDHQSINSIRWR